MCHRLLYVPTCVWIFICQVGGYYDMGTSFVKYSYPIATTTALLSWGLLAFPQVHPLACKTRPATVEHSFRPQAVSLVLALPARMRTLRPANI